MNKYHQYIVFISQMLIVLAMEMVNPFIPTFVQQLNGGTIQDVAPISAFIIIAPMLGMILMAPVWGFLGDKYGYKPMLIRAALALIIMQWLVSFAHSVLQLLVLRFFHGCFSGFIAAMQTYAVAHGETAARARILARLQSSKAIGTAFGGSLGGLSIIFLSLNNLFQFAAILCVFPLILIIFFLPNLSVIKEKKTRKTAKNFYSPGILTISTLIIFSQIAKFLPNPVFSLYVEQIIHANPIITGFLYSLPGIAIIVGSNLMGSIFDKQRKLAEMRGSATPLLYYFLIFGCTGALLTLAHSFTSNLTGIIFIRFGWGLVFAGLLPALFATLSDRGAQQGLYIGLGNSLAKTGNLLGVLIGGYSASILPLTQLFLLSSFSYVVIILICLSNIKKQSIYSVEY